jgi:hypothetical protein
LDFLPPYSPELNPIERVWKLTRRLCLHNRYFAFLDSVAEAVEGQLANWLGPNETLRRLCANIQDARFSLKQAAGGSSGRRLLAQAVVNVYSEPHRSDGHTVWLHFPESGALDTFNVAPGNLYSDVQPIKLRGAEPIRITVAHVIPPHTPPADTEWLKHVRVHSQKLTAFWGRPIFINATVLIPKGYAEHPNVHYPVVFTMGHTVPFSFTTTPASDRQRQATAVTGLETGYDLYRSWNSSSFPHFIAISFQQPTPFFPDSYSVNSVNQGPYGDAMVEEVIPALEKQFCIIPKPYARQVEGASTGGWQALGLQLHYPDFFGATWGSPTRSHRLPPLPARQHL